MSGFRCQVSGVRRQVSGVRVSGWQGVRVSGCQGLGGGLTEVFRAHGAPFGN